MDSAKVEFRQTSGNALVKQMPVNEIRDDLLRRRAARSEDGEEPRARRPLCRSPGRAEEDREDARPPGDAAGHRVLQGPLRRQAGDGGQHEDRRCGPNDEGLRRRQPEELSLLRGLGSGGRPAGGRRLVRSGGGILRPARRRPLARLPDAGGRGRRPRAAGAREDRGGAGRLRQSARHRGRGRFGPDATAWPPAWERPPPWSP